MTPVLAPNLARSSRADRCALAARQRQDNSWPVTNAVPPACAHHRTTKDQGRRLRVCRKQRLGRIPRRRRVRLRLACSVGGQALTASLVHSLSLLICCSADADANAHAAILLRPRRPRTPPGHARRRVRCITLLSLPASACLTTPPPPPTAAGRAADLLLRETAALLIAMLVTACCLRQCGQAPVSRSR